MTAATTTNQSTVHPSFWVNRTLRGPLVQQVMVTDDFGNLVKVNHSQFSVSFA